MSSSWFFLERLDHEWQDIPHILLQHLSTPKYAMSHILQSHASIPEILESSDPVLMAKKRCLWVWRDNLRSSLGQKDQRCSRLLSDTHISWFHVSCGTFNGSYISNQWLQQAATVLQHHKTWALWLRQIISPFLIGSISFTCGRKEYVPLNWKP
jgi:hypothetical protein